MSKTEKQNIKLKKVVGKTAYNKLLIKYAELNKKYKELEKENKRLRERIEFSDFRG